MADPGNDGKQTFAQKFGSEVASFRYFVYHEELVEGDVPDKTQGLFLGRTKTSWAKIGLFYLIFYGFLAGFFAVMLTIFLTTVNSPDDGGPKLTQFIKNQPGLTRIDQKNEALPKKYDSADQDILSKYSKVVQNHLDKFNTTDHSGEKCKIGDITGIPKDAKPCVFDTTLLGKCDGSTNDTFGLTSKKPCIFIKINKVYDWVPKGSNGYLTLSCNKGEVMPEGFLLSGFPYRKQKSYQSPIVAVKVDVSGGAQSVECTLKGKDIEVSGSFNPSRAYGKIKFEVSSK